MKIRVKYACYQECHLKIMENEDFTLTSLLIPPSPTITPPSPYFYSGNAISIATYFGNTTNFYYWPSIATNCCFLIFFDEYIRPPSLESLYYIWRDKLCHLVC